MVMKIIVSIADNILIKSKNHYDVIYEVQFNKDSKNKLG